MALCGDDVDVRERIRHAVSVALMLVNTAVICATTSSLELVPGLMLCSGDATGGEAQARERRMATEAGVGPRLTAPIPLSEARTLGLIEERASNRAQRDLMLQRRNEPSV